MAGSSMTFTYDTGGGGRIKRVLASWVSDSTAGTVSGTTRKLNGYLLRGVTDPGAAAPDADYDIVLTDDEGANVLGNMADDLVDRHTSNTESVDFYAPTSGARPSVCSALTISISAAGNSKVGQLILYLDGEIQGT